MSIKIKLLAILLIAAITLLTTACAVRASQNDTDSIDGTINETNDVQETNYKEYEHIPDSPRSIVLTSWEEVEIFLNATSVNSDTFKNNIKNYRCVTNDNELKELTKIMSEAPIIFANGHNSELKLYHIEYVVDFGCIDAIYYNNNKFMIVTTYLPDSPVMKNGLYYADVDKEDNIRIDDVVFDCVRPTLEEKRDADICAYKCAYKYHYGDYFIIIRLFSEGHSEEITLDWLKSFKDIISTTPFVFTTFGEIAKGYRN